MNAQETPRTNAHALHALLSEVEQSPSNEGLHGPWAKVLGTDVASADFARRFGEVMALYHRSVEQVAMLPARSQAIYEKSLPLWWKAVVAPDMRWDAGLTSSIIEDSQLSLLHTLGDVVEATFRGSPAAPGGTSVAEIGEAVQGWLGELAGDESILPNDALRLSLIESLRHVMWLIDQRAMFGDAPVARAAQEVLGAAVVATPHVPPAHQASWKKRVVIVAGSIAIFNGIVGGTQTAIENTTTAVVTAIEVGEVVVGELLDE